ncbi:MAG: alpha/beta hydrolase [Planctomycetota bacterium]
MAEITILYGTNRRHRGKRWHPSGYGTAFSEDGAENLRFGRAELEYDQDKVQRYLRRDCGPVGTGDGQGLAGYLGKRARKAKLTAFVETLERDVPDHEQPEARRGSAEFFATLKQWMDAGDDVLVYIHGYNVNWNDALSGAAALQLMLESKVPDAAQTGGLAVRATRVVLFSWPSDGSMMPFVAYRDDRTEAEASGRAVGRALLKFRDFLVHLRAAAKRERGTLCGGRVHLLCHSMGNYVLGHALARMAQFHRGATLPRLFDEVFLCAADVNDDALEPSRTLGALHATCSRISVYSNTGDFALDLSDWTKGNPERLGSTGPANMRATHRKAHHIDCSAIVTGAIEHDYYLGGQPNADIALSLAGVTDDAASRGRERVEDAPRSYRLPRQ